MCGQGRSLHDDRGWKISLSISISRASLVVQLMTMASGMEMCASLVRMSGGSQGYTKKGMNDWRMAGGENRKTNEKDPMAFIIKIQLFSDEVYQSSVDAHICYSWQALHTHTHTTEIALKLQAEEQEEVGLCSVNK